MASPLPQMPSLSASRSFLYPPRVLPSFSEVPSGTTDGGPKGWDLCNAGFVYGSIVVNSRASLNGGWPGFSISEASAQFNSPGE